MKLVFQIIKSLNFINQTNSLDKQESLQHQFEMSNNQPSRLPDKKKNDLLKKFLNAQQYTKTLKKNASNLVQQNNYTTFSYDQIQTYPEIPQSAKLPSTKLFSKQHIYSIDTLNNDSQDFSIKAKSKKSHGHINLTQSSNQIPYLKKKSSYSHVQKSQGGNKSVSGNFMMKQTSKANKDYDVHSMNKEKYPPETMHESLGGMKTESFFKLKNKKSFNYSNVHEYESQKLSAQDQRSCDKLNRKAKKMEGSYVDLIRQQDQSTSPYNLSPTNFIKLINKVEQLQAVIMLYSQAVSQMKKKIFQLGQTIRSQQMSQIYVDSLKQQLIEEKTKNAELREKISFQQTNIKEYQQVMLQSVQKVAKYYQKQISKITILQKQNHFLKFMLRLQLQQNPQTPQSKIKQNNTSSEEDNVSNSKMHITKNLTQFKDKFTKLIDMNKTKLN